MDCVAMAERQTTQRTRQRVNEKEAEEISFKDNDAAYGNVQTSEKNGKLEALKRRHRRRLLLLLLHKAKIDQVAVICQTRTTILKHCTVGSKERFVFFDDIKASSSFRLSKDEERKSNTDDDRHHHYIATTNATMPTLNNASLSALDYNSSPHHVEIDGDNKEEAIGEERMKKKKKD